MAILLETKKLTKRFGGLLAIDNLEFHILRGEVLGLIGPNGSGKSTLFNLISGFLCPTSGRILFDGKEITGLSPERTSGLGIVRSWQATTIFGHFERTVLENIMVASHLRERTGFWGGLLSTPGYRREGEELEKESLRLLDLMGLLEHKDRIAMNMPVALQRRLAVANCLATHPQLVMLDEPVAGMSMEESRDLMQRVSQLRNQGYTLLIVEHNVKVAMDVCDRMVVLNYGRKIAEGPPTEVRQNKEVIAAYLGEEG
jgi:branched-chain amino acid transport system ATP-binding protein